MKTFKNLWMGLLLAGIAVVGPMVAFAGISVIYPSSTHTATIDATPPITFATGADNAKATTLGFVSSASFGTNAARDYGASFTISLNGLSGGQVTIDKYATITSTTDVSTFKMQVGTALTGTLTAPSVLKVRVWSGGTAPTADGSSGVCAVLDLTAAAATESTGGPCDTATATTFYIQVVYSLPAASSGSSTVALRPSSIVFA